MSITQLRRIARQQGFGILKRGDEFTLIDLSLNTVGFGGTAEEVERYLRE